jgi:hypothetical protein
MNFKWNGRGERFRIKWRENVGDFLLERKRGMVETRKGNRAGAVGIKDGIGS